MDDDANLDDRRLLRYHRCKDRYSKDKKIGEGTYAVVYEGVDRQSLRKVAIKKIKMSSSVPGLDISALRELKALTSLRRHPNIVELVDVFSSKSNLQLVLAHYPYDLERLIREREVPFSQGDVKAWMAMLLRGLEYMHRRCIIHRDLKPSNLLVGEDGIIRIGDFGLARSIALPLSLLLSSLPQSNNMAGQMTSQVVTRWYRAPELLLGAKHYTGAVDVWAAGCIFAELLLRTPFLPGDTDIGQLQCMCRALGTPGDADWPSRRSLPDYIALPEHPRTPLSAIFPAASADSLDLLARMLSWDPGRRCTAREALAHSYFAKNHPPPTPAHLLPKPPLSRPKPAVGIQPKRLFT